MAKDKGKTVPKTQMSITSYVKGAQAIPATDEEESDIEISGSVTKNKSAGIQTSDLPPINHIPSIFADIVSRNPKIKDVAKYLQGRKLRVATMCSGTESPLLALDLIHRSIKEQYQISLDIEHVFSCEIEPFKQAYIERNFQPPILFRDVCELGETHATTAYGALVEVPGEVDILIAGTSCVDYSNLNNEKQDIDADGESGRTFRGMMSWVKNHRPPIVILENVCSAPWDKVIQYFKKNGYSASQTRLDTKNYYIPHTRMRGYLVAVDKKHSDIPEQWLDLIPKLKRPASSTLDAFLLPSDDPRIHQAREKLVRESYNGPDRRTGRIDWGRCESRHQRARVEEELGLKRPLTGWDEGGSCKVQDFAWGDWATGQVERVWDLMDISLLRSATKGVDPSYKTQVWNLSQNVDRSTGSSKVGICPCLTPSMIPYITNRGGPMVGLEALSLQGLPVDELLLTRESEDNLADLAGNAMSTTVVGTCIVASLILAKKLLPPGQSTDDADEKMQVDSDEHIRTQSLEVENHIKGEDKLTIHSLDLSTTAPSTLANVLSNADRSSRLCECEGRKDITDRVVQRCVDCGSSSCIKCGGRPEHNMRPIDLTEGVSTRLSPFLFEKDLKSILPMCLALTNVSKELLDRLWKKIGVDDEMEKPLWPKWRDAVIKATETEFRFIETKRQDVWVAIYESRRGSLELTLHPQQPEWRLFAKPDQSEPAGSDIRKMLESSPVGRLVCDKNLQPNLKPGGGLLEGKWDFALPLDTRAKIALEGVESEDPALPSLIPSWEANLGLQGDAFKNRVVYSRLRVTVPEEDQSSFDRNISGIYTLFQKCGTANSALHKRQAELGEDNLPLLFMLLDPSRCGDPNDDSFVFSISRRRYEYGETRPIICRLGPKWRQTTPVEHNRKDVECYIPYKWVKASKVQLEPSYNKEASFAVPSDVFQIDASQNGCGSANAVLICRVPLQEQAGPEWPLGIWQEVDKVHERGTFKALAWLLERTRAADDNFADWQKVSSLDGSHEHADDRCERCAPTSPRIQWRKVGRKAVAIEDTVGAGEYERRLKGRPTPFVTQLKLEEKTSIGTVRIGINIPSLLHRAVSRLPIIKGNGRLEKKPVLSWRLRTEFSPAAKIIFPKFRLLSNKMDQEHTQPQNFKISLRPEQLRSLHWMLEQEDVSQAQPFFEEEISEAIMAPLGWRAEGRAQREVLIRGGVLADQVGYGKTAITLALLDCTQKHIEKELKNKISRDGEDFIKGKIAVKASLIIVPPHLTGQWASEVKKFTGKKFQIEVLSTATSLNSLTIEKVQDADMVIVASNLFSSSVYLDNLQTLSGGGALPAQDGRYFVARLDEVLESLKSQVETLRDQGSASLMKAVKTGRRKHEEAEVFVPTKRLKGKSYREAVQSKSGQVDEKVEVVTKALSSAKVSDRPSKTTQPSKSSSSTRQFLDAVVIERQTISKSSTSNDGATSSDAMNAGDTSDDSMAPKPRKRRAAAKKISIVISDDEGESSDFQPDDDDDDEIKPQRSGSSKRTKSDSRSTKKRKESSEEGFSAEGTGSESEESEAAETSEDENPRKKARPTPKAKVNAKRKTSSASSDDDKMDLDESEPSTAKKGRKRKSDDEEKPAKKQKRREDTDPWKLETSTVKKDWSQMRSPPLEMFHFARKVVDEYTYLEKKNHTLVTRLTADRHWVLSGTPPTHDFAALKTIAAFMNIHLGVDDDGEGKVIVKKRQREQTNAERFHSFREVHSLEWHAHRHEIGQAFLDRFVRQNIAEIDEIPLTEHFEKIVLPAAERAIYLELEHHLRALDMVIKRGKKNESDREKRLAQSLGESSTAEEALLKRCSHFDLDTGDRENAMKACEVIVKERKRQLEDCKRELATKLQKALASEKTIPRTGDESLFREFIRHTRDEGLGDKEATELMLNLFNKAGISGTTKSGSSKAQEMKSNTSKAKGKGKDDVSLSAKEKDLIWKHREETHEIRKLAKELTGRVRSLRYFTVVRDLQKQNDDPPEVSCPSCGRTQIPIDEVSVLSSCGHVGCHDCVVARAEKEECVYAASKECKAAARVLNVVKGTTLGVDDEARDGRGKHYGLKLEKVVDLVKKRLPADERVLIFVQFPDLMKKVAEVLTANKVKFLEIKGSASVKSKNLLKFQDSSDERVLLLNVMDESASGANLTVANHAIFLSPLLAPSQEIYDACEIQAIGRLRRYGQTKHVHVWRFLSADTIDVEIFEQRTGKALPL